MYQKWNDRFIKLALEVSKWSKDYKKVGCVIVNADTKKVLATGFNGMPQWFDDTNLHDLDSYDRGRMISHAEINALNTLDESNYNENLIMYITKPPCKWCSLSIVNSSINIKQIIYIPNSNLEFDIKYCVNESLDILSQNNIKLLQYNISPDETFKIVVSQWFNYTDFEKEILIDDINEFIYYTEDLVNNLDLYLETNTSYIDSLVDILNVYTYEKLLKFSKETGSTDPKLFLEWFDK